MAVAGSISDDEYRRIVKRAFEGTPESRNHLLKNARRRTRYQNKARRAETRGMGCAVTALALAGFVATGRGWRG